MDEAFRRFYFHQILLVGCSDDLFGESGEFASPGYPTAPYPNNAYCLWRIRVPRHKKVQVTFEHFNLEEHCNRDRVIVYDGYTTGSSRAIGTYCSGHSHLTLQSSGNEMAVLFRTDGARQRSGFKASYKAVSGGWFSSFSLRPFVLCDNLHNFNAFRYPTSHISIFVADIFFSY